MKRRTKKNAISGLPKIVLATLVVRILGAFKRFSEDPGAYWRNWSDFISYRSFVQDYFQGSKLDFTREKLFSRIFEITDPNPIVVFEYGVAHGYLASLCLRKFDRRIKNWHGFDTFIGLPNAWRNLPEAYFSNGGVTPDINDSRVHWHIGLVEETVTKDLLTDEIQTVIHIFDLDLYEPSLFVWNVIKHELKPGDILYFDEAFDEGERKLLIEQVLTFAKFEFIGSTIMALALRYRENEK